MLKMWLLWYIRLTILVDLVASARILAVLPMPAQSHHHLFRAVLKTLAQRGHEIVSYTPLLMEKPVANYTEIFIDTVESAATSRVFDLPKCYTVVNTRSNWKQTRPECGQGWQMLRCPAQANKIDIVAWEAIMTLEELTGLMSMSPVAAAITLMSESGEIVEKTFQCNKIQDLLKSNEKFDLIFLEALFAQETLLGLGHTFSAPVISFQPFGSFSVVNKVSGNTLSLSYIPDFSMPLSTHMTFYERAINAYSILKSLYYFYNIHLPSQAEKMKSYYNDPTMPPLLDMLQNISLVVNNAHPYSHYSQPYTPNIVPLGGIHLTKASKPLPPALKTFLDEAKHGVIYLALGSFLPDHLLPQKHFDNFINVFSRLPQRVLWKTGLELKGLPGNIMTSKWVPQQDVLAHPNVVLFMTHGGLFSQHEAINAGVPVVCTPYFGDQFMNAKFYEEKGIGFTLLYNILSEDTIYSAITTVLNNPEYKENMQRLSRIYRDQPVTPADSLVYWVEYVMRHNGAHHLRPVSALLPWYQLALLDVFAVILLAASVSLVLLYLAMMKTISFIKGDNKSTPNSASTRKKKN